MKLRNILMRIHVGTLIIAVMNGLFKHFTTYRLAGNIELGIELLVVLSGLMLFFFYLKPFKKINVYFSVYAAVAFFLIIGLIFRSLFLGVVLSILLFPLIPDDKVYEENGIIIATPFQGLMARCCTYQIKERHLLIFEKDHGFWELYEEGPVDFETVNIKSNEDEIEINYSTDHNKGMFKKKKLKK